MADINELKVDDDKHDKKIPVIGLGTRLVGYNTFCINYLRHVYKHYFVWIWMAESRYHT